MISLSKVAAGMHSSPAVRSGKGTTVPAFSFSSLNVSTETFKELKEKAGTIVPFPFRAAAEQCVPAAPFDREIVRQIETLYAEDQEESDEDQTLVDEDATYQD